MIDFCTGPQKSHYLVTDLHVVGENIWWGKKGETGSSDLNMFQICSFRVFWVQTIRFTYFSTILCLTYERLSKLQYSLFKNAFYLNGSKIDEACTQNMIKIHSKANFWRGTWWAVLGDLSFFRSDSRLSAFIFVHQLMSSIAKRSLDFLICWIFWPNLI